MRDYEVREVSCRLKCEGPTSLVCVLQTTRKPLQLESGVWLLSRGFRKGSAGSVEAVLNGG